MWYASDEPDAVEHLDAEGVVPAVVQRLGQCLPGGCAEPQAAQVLFSRAWVVEHRLHHGRDVDEDGRPVPGDHLEDAAPGVVRSAKITPVAPTPNGNSAARSRA